KNEFSVCEQQDPATGNVIADHLLNDNRDEPHQLNDEFFGGTDIRLRPHGQQGSSITLRFRAQIPTDYIQNHPDVELAVFEGSVDVTGKLEAAQAGGADTPVSPRRFEMIFLADLADDDKSDGFLKFANTRETTTRTITVLNTADVTAEFSNAADASNASGSFQIETTDNRLSGFTYKAKSFVPNDNVLATSV